MRTRIVVVSGMDGSGKSTIIGGLEKVLRASGYSTCAPWLRYNHYLTRGVLGVARWAGLTRYETRGGRRVVGYHEFHRWPLLSTMFILSTFLDTLAASVAKVYIPAYVLRRIVICDRWVPDILVDVAIDTGRGTLTRDRVWGAFWLLIPRQAKTFVVTRHACDILDCREANRLDRHFTARLGMYGDLCRLSHSQEIDNRGPIDQSVGQIMKALMLADAT